VGIGLSNGKSSIFIGLSVGNVDDGMNGRCAVNLHNAVVAVGDVGVPAELVALALP
jgi:hypothetical protein